MATTNTFTNVININNILSVLKLKEEFNTIFEPHEVEWGPGQYCNGDVYCPRGYLRIITNDKGEYLVETWSENVSTYWENRYVYYIREGKVFEFDGDDIYDNTVRYGHYYWQFKEGTLKKWMSGKFPDIYWVDEYDPIESEQDIILDTPRWNQDSIACRYLRALLAALRDITMAE